MKMGTFFILFGAALTLCVEHAAATSFDCSRAIDPSEKAICADPMLSAKDEQLARLFRQRRTEIARHNGDVRGFVIEERRWLAMRVACVGNPRCISMWYDQRIATLRGNNPVPTDSQRIAPPRTDPATRDTVPVARTDTRARDAAITSEKDKWASFVAGKAAQFDGDSADLLVFLNTNSPRVRSGDIARTLSDKIDAQNTVTIAVIGGAERTIRDQDGRTTSSDMLVSYGIRADQQNFLFPSAQTGFSAAGDLIVISRQSLNAFPFLGNLNARSELIGALTSGALVELFTIKGVDISAKRAARLAAEEEGRRKDEQRRAEIRRQAAERAKKSAEIKRELEDGKITDFGLIVIDNVPPVAACAVNSNDLSLIDAFDDLPEIVARLPRHAVGNDDEAFIALRRNTCSAFVATGDHLKSVIVGLDRDHVAYSVVPQIIAPRDAANRIAAIAAIRTDKKKRDEAAMEKQLEQKKDADEARAIEIKKQDALLPKCDSSDARELVKGAIEKNAVSNIVTLRLLDMSSIRELSLDVSKPERRCAALLVLNSGEQAVEYRLWLNSDKSAYLVSVREIQ